MATTIAPPELELPVTGMPDPEPSPPRDVWMAGWLQIETSVAQAAEEAADEHPQRQPEGVTTLDLLARQRALLIDPSHWVKGSMARDAEGGAVDYYDPAAVSWCNIGAIEVSTYRANGGGSLPQPGMPLYEANERALEFSDEAAMKLGLADERGARADFASDRYWNDDWRTTHQDVMRVNALACQLAAYEQRVRR